jgi:hypothetical protein
VIAPKKTATTSPACGTGYEVPTSLVEILKKFEDTSLREETSSYHSIDEPDLLAALLLALRNRCGSLARMALTTSRKPQRM